MIPATAFQQRAAANSSFQSDPTGLLNSTLQPASGRGDADATTMVSLGSHREVTTKLISGAASSSENTESKPQVAESEQSPKQMILDPKINTLVEKGAS